jgi:transcriptional regulator with XRE-family HTH domain
VKRAPRPDYALAEAVLSLREERGLSREALAFRSGVTPTTLVGIELAQLVPRWDTVRLLARGLGTTLVDLSAAVERSDTSDSAGSEEGPVA